MTPRDRVIAAVEALLNEAKGLAPEGSDRDTVKTSLMCWDQREEEVEFAIEYYILNAAKGAR